MEAAGGVDGVWLGLSPPSIVAVESLPAASLYVVKLHQQVKPDMRKTDGESSDGTSPSK